MAKLENEVPLVEKVNTPGPQFSMDQLMLMLIKQQEETAKAYNKLAEATLESRKPYVDPAVIEAKKQALEERKKAVALEMRKRVETKRQCLHTRTDSQGAWDPQGRLNIKWQEHSNGIITGVCGTCGSQFDARNPKDRVFLQRDGNAYLKMGHARGVVAS